MEVTFSALVRFQNLKGIAATKKKKKKKQRGGVEFAFLFFFFFFFHFGFNSRLEISLLKIPPRWMKPKHVGNWLVCVWKSAAKDEEIKI